MCKTYIAPKQGSSCLHLVLNKPYSKTKAPNTKETEIGYQKRYVKINKRILKGL
jgi:hypothetical protein